MYTLFGDKMKFIKVTVLILLLFLLCGCSDNTPQRDKPKITINHTYDDTVNGYKTEENNSGVIPAEDVTVDENEGEPVTQKDNGTAEETSNLTYCANKSSKKFHLSACGSVKTMNEENKYITTDREKLISEGYTPCKTCNP